MQQNDTRFTDQAFAEWIAEDPQHRAKWNVSLHDLSKIMQRAQELKKLEQLEPAQV